MMPLFEELDYQETPLGAISLRRREDPRLDGRLVYEVKLGDEYLMSSLFTEAEKQLATLGLELLDGSSWDVVVGGLGLGYTAASVLGHPQVRSLTVIEIMAPVINWHKMGLVPLGQTLTADPRCDLQLADFFKVAAGDAGFVPGAPNRRVHAVLLDIDHSPLHWLNSSNSAFYTQEGLRQLADKLHPGGVFGLWSNEPPEPAFVERLGLIFDSVCAQVVSFTNPYSGGESSNTVYLARKLPQ